MCNILNSIFDSLLSLNWIEVLKVSAALWTAGIATYAVNTWRRQTKANRRVDFLSELLDAIHEFSESIHSPIEMVRIVKIGIESHRATPSESSDEPNPHLVAYIQKHGEHDGKKLYEYLEPCHPASAEIRALSAKGQIFGFPDYHILQASCAQVVSVSDRIAALAAMIGITSWYWKNPEVQKALIAVTDINPDDLKTALKTADGSVISYIKSNFRDTYK